MQMSIRMGTLVAALSRELPGCFFCRPEGGIYLWLNTPGLDGERAARASFSEGVKLVPGAAFSVRGEKIEAVRLSISRHGAHDLEMAVCSISSAWREQEWNH
jgi:DNA-binding transcriptional MocR family regulator